MITKLEGDALEFFKHRDAAQVLIEKFNELIDKHNNLVESVKVLDDELAVVTEAVFENSLESLDN